jgi:pilus assembly protein CpaF
MDRKTIFTHTINNYLKPVDEFRKDESVSEIMINGFDEIYVERNGRLERTNARFDDEESLLAVARNIAQFTNRRITEVTDRFDSRLPDGSRIHVVMPRCARVRDRAQGARGTQNALCMSIRKFSRNAFTLEGLVQKGSVTETVKEYLELVIALERNVIVSGGTGTGKTSFLNAISSRIPDNERIIVIEDTLELDLQQAHVISFEAAAPDRHGKNAVTIRELFHSALRMRPNRIVIGECRGAEALDLIQAMTSGHGGSMSTLHANTPQDALNRLETMALSAQATLPQVALRSQIASAIQVVVQLLRMQDGKRLVTDVTEVNGLSPDHDYRLNPVFQLVPGAVVENGPTIHLEPSGNPSIFANEMKLHKEIAAKVRLTKPIFM